MTSNPSGEAAFVMEDGDRLHCILVSDEILFDCDPGMATVITFFVIRRASGSNDIVNVNRTFRGDHCISRTVQKKEGLPEAGIRAEVDSISSVFAAGVRENTGYTIRWNVLDLSDTGDQTEQIRRIRAWGRLGVRTEVDFQFSMN